MARNNLEMFNQAAKNYGRQGANSPQPAGTSAEGFPIGYRRGTDSEALPEVGVVFPVDRVRRAARAATEHRENARCRHDADADEGAHAHSPVVLPAIDRYKGPDQRQPVCAVTLALDHRHACRQGQDKVRLRMQY